MAWMSDEKYELMQDTREKRITARSARHTRSHCGKGGSVKFPSDYLTKKERDAMNGECKSYRMNDPMTWEEFKKLPDDLKIVYIKALRQKYGAPDNAIAEMFGVSGTYLSRTVLKPLGIAMGRGAGGGKRKWDKEGFLVWRNGVKVEKTDICADELIAVNEDAEIREYAENDIEMTQANVDNMAIPTTGEMCFEGEIGSVLRSIQRLLEGAHVHLMVKWDVLENNDIPAEPDEEERTRRLKEAATIANYAILNEERKKATGSRG